MKIDKDITNQTTNIWEEISDVVHDLSKHYNPHNKTKLNIKKYHREQRGIGNKL